MRIVVCIRQGRNGEAGPFDACAYEAALRVEGAEVILLSMGVPAAEGYLSSLTRLGAAKAVLLTDRVFAGADTLATAYALSLAIKKLSPDMVFCGRQTMEGDTAQVGPMLSECAGFSLITNVTGILRIGNGSVLCRTRDGGEEHASFPVLLTIERINTLRLPSLRSKTAPVEVWSAADIGADPARCGLTGSPTRVLSTCEREAGKRKCRFLSPEDFFGAVEEGISRRMGGTLKEKCLDACLPSVLCVGEGAAEYGKAVCSNVTITEENTPEAILSLIDRLAPSAVLWGSDMLSKRCAAKVAARRGLGLCADCTALDTDGETLFMIRPALSGSVTAKIKSLTKPALATVRTVEADVKDVVLSAGYGAASSLEDIKRLATRLGAELGSSRKAVENGLLPYETQVGLTGRSVAPPVYIAIGVSGAVHHIVGMCRAGTVIAVNPDPEARIFEYADYGIRLTAEEFFRAIGPCI